MSTTTLLEVPDAQMLDYSIDSDFTMHATAHPSEWLSVEATMSDDSLPQREYSETIEIEMEHNDEDEITEYEMADGEESYGHDEVFELEDVDFADPSRVTSPQHICSISSPLLLDVATPQPTSSADLSLPAPVIRSESLPSPHAVPGTGELYPGYNTDALPTDTFTPVPLSAAPSHEPLATSLSVTNSELAHNSEGADSHDHLPSSESVAAVVATSEQPEPVPFLLEGEGATVDDSLDNGEAAEVHEPHTHGDPLDIGEDTPSEQREQPTDTVQTVVEQEQDNVSNNDPHEISDGVYIDPPPAVLLSISSSSHRVDCCLFNPNEYASSSTASDMVLLLSQRPTLYYEPLNNVFEAFRQEEIIGSFPDFTDGELVLEAYDLDLRISEENIHIGEVTLHELNVLHDGIDLTGPLRLRLSTVPRFITRYHALRDQVAQLTLAAGRDSESHPHEATNPEPVQEENDALDVLQVHNSESFAESVDATEQSTEEATRAEDANDSAESDVFSGVRVADVADSEEEQAPAEAVQESVEDHENHEEQSTRGVDAEDVTAAYGTEFTAEQAPNVLEADEGHRVADAAEAGGEYTDEQPEEDESFGEQPPEDLSSEVQIGDPHRETLQIQYAQATTEPSEAAFTSVDEDPTILSTASADSTDSPTSDPTKIAEGAQVEGLEDTEFHSDVLDDAPVPDVTDNEPYAELGEFDNFDEFEEEEPSHNDQEAVPGQEPEEWDEFEDEEETESPVMPHEDDRLSKHSSETLSTLSKRSRDEEEEDETLSRSPPDSPDSKRIRIQ